MTKCILSVSFCLIFAAFSQAAVPSLSVTVSDAGGKVAFKGKTNSSGTFATSKLAPGEYAVQFNGSAEGNYAIVVSAGKAKVVADSVTGEKFGKGGVAVKVKVGPNLNITGQVSSGGLASKAGDGRMKIVNGKRWFLVRGSTGSNLGEHWVEEGSPEARNVQGLSNAAVGRMQERGAAGLTGN